MRKFMENCKKPRGLYGKIIVKMMNSGHKKVASWGLSHLEIKDNDKILDVGCGGGGNIYRLLKKYPHIRVDGVDYSPISVEVSLDKVKKYKNRSNIFLKDVTKLSLDDESYNSVYASETIYFWNPIEIAFSEIYRILKNNGQFLIICEMGDKEKGEKWTKFTTNMKIYDAKEIEELLLKAGFKDIKIYKKGLFIALNAKK